MVYALAEAYLPHRFTQFKDREFDILCTLRGSKHMPTRLRVQEWVAEYGKSRKVQKVISSQLNTATRTTVNMQYFQQMYNSKIIVTVNPSNWEGDFRLWESLATGALIFVDPLFVPHPFPLEDGVHVIYFDNNNKTELFEKLDYYRSHPAEAERIAVAGYLHAMKHHRTVNLIDYILRTAHYRNATARYATADNKAIPVSAKPNYFYTGQYLNSLAKSQEKAILKCNRPGIYDYISTRNTTVQPRMLNLKECEKKAPTKDPGMITFMNR